MQNSFEDLELKLDYTFKNKTILKKSLTHSSYANEHGDDLNAHNQRLEFLGDAILEIVVSEKLFEDFEDDDEGRLTTKRANLVCEENLSKVAYDIELYQYIYHSNGMTKDDIKNNDNILCDTLEAVIAAIYLDGGYNEAKRFILENIYYKFDIISTNYKSVLREYCNRHKIELEYKLLNEFGPDHKKSFEVCCLLNNKCYKSAIGKSKKKAEQIAAKNVINDLDIKENI